jgi:hypothetical protein
MIMMRSRTSRLRSPRNGFAGAEEPARGPIIRQRGRPHDACGALGNRAATATHVRGDPAGTDGIHKDAIGPQLIREDVRERIQRGFRCRIAGNAADDGSHRAFGLRTGVSALPSGSGLWPGAAVCGLLTILGLRGLRCLNAHLAVGNQRALRTFLPDQCVLRCSYLTLVLRKGRLFAISTASVEKR